jgi:hypothetical protein
MARAVTRATCGPIPATAASSSGSRHRSPPRPARPAPPRHAQARRDRTRPRGPGPASALRCPTKRRDTPPQRGALIWKDSMTDHPIPATRPANPRFSSGPCKPNPPDSIRPTSLRSAVLGRSHRAALGKAKLKAAIETRARSLACPADYRIGIVPASDTGAVEMAMWSLLGARPCTMLAWESFRRGLGHRCGQAAEAGRREVHDGALRRDRRSRGGRFRHRRGVHLERHHQRRALPNGDAIPADRAGPDDLRRDLAPPSRRTCPGTSSM